MGLVPPSLAPHTPGRRKQAEGLRGAYPLRVCASRSLFARFPLKGGASGPPVCAPSSRGRRMNPSMGLGGGSCRRHSRERKARGLAAAPAADTPARGRRAYRLRLAQTPKDRHPASPFPIPLLVRWNRAIPGHGRRRPIGSALPKPFVRSLLPRVCGARDGGTKFHGWTCASLGRRERTKGEIEAH